MSILRYKQIYRRHDNMGKFSEWNSTDEMNYTCKYTNDWTNPISGEVEPLEITVTATKQQLQDLPLYGVNAQEMIKRSAISELENYKHHRIIDSVVSYAKERTSFFDALDDCLGFERPEIWCDIKKMEYVTNMLQRFEACDIKYVNDDNFSINQQKFAVIRIYDRLRNRYKRITLRTIWMLEDKIMFANCSHIRNSIIFEL